MLAGLIQAGIYAGMYLAVWRLTKDKYIASIAAILVLFSGPVLVSFYWNFSLGRSLAVQFIPMAVVGMYQLVTENKDTWLLVLGICGVIHSNVLATVLVVGVCGMIMLCYLKEWVTNIEKWKSLILSIGSVMLLTISYWLPMLEQWFAQTYKASEPWAWVDEYVRVFYSVLIGTWIGAVFPPMAIGLGLWMIIEKQSRQFKTFYFLGIGLFLITAVPKFWQLTRSLFKFLQFPKRLYIHALILLIFAFAIFLKEKRIKEKYLRVGVIVALVVSFYFSDGYIGGRLEDREDLGYVILHEENAGLGSGAEYLPLQMSKKDVDGSLVTYDASQKTFNGSREEGKYLVKVDGLSEFYDVPCIWYKGYKAVTAEGNELSVTQEQEKGFVRVQSEEKKIGETTITVWYEGTALQRISYIVNVISVIGFVICGGYKIVTYKRRLRNKYFQKNC